MVGLLFFFFFFIYFIYIFGVGFGRENGRFPRDGRFPGEIRYPLSDCQTPLSVTILSWRGSTGDDRLARTYVVYNS